MNVGCGSIMPADWVNVDGDTWANPDATYLGLTEELAGHVIQRNGWLAEFDCIVANHVICHIDHHELPVALRNIRSMLKPGGVFRVLVPDLFGAYLAWGRGDEDWFPQSDETGDLGAKFCTYLTWFGTVKSVFTYGYLSKMLLDAGFEDVSLALKCGETKFGEPGITDLDDRCGEALIVEARR
jgi:predicted SAM-dependent methyltransferase